MTYEELLRAVHQALPETEGKLAIKRGVNYLIDNAFFFLPESNAIVGKEEGYGADDTI